jgi:uncharacterized protein
MQKTELALRPEEAASEEIIKKHLAANIGVRFADITGFTIKKRSTDARSRQVVIRLQVDVFVNEPFSPPVITSRALQNVSNSAPVYIAGCGPAGLFAAIRFIELGLKPVILERGKDVKSRRRDLAAINKQGVVNPESNYCFGEGGAGTYSDGKLYTRSGKRGNIDRILETFVQFGADPIILAEAHPHIGTNKLPQIITAMREEIIRCGGEIHFDTKLKGITFQSTGITGIYINGSTSISENQYIECNSLILATGHSARDIFQLLHDQNILIESKPFALGVRIEHPQNIIDQIQYHCADRGAFLPPASYSQVHQAGNKGVYSFCMCPGGIIAPAATNPGEIVVNGWSPSKRNNPFANSGIVVSVDETDFKSLQKSGPLAAMQFQETIEQKAFKFGGGSLKAPAQRMMDFIDGKTSGSIPASSYIPGLTSVALEEVMTPEITKALREGLAAFGQKMKGYLTNEAVLVGVESRTSSPVRIPRDKETFMHPDVSGLFPCAEGAGYAGGIVSAAIDGERCAEALLQFATSLK